MMTHSFFFKFGTTLSLIAPILLSSPMVQAKEYYKWVDQNGSTHYTATPPPKTAKKKGKIETYGSKTPVSAPVQTPNSNPEKDIIPLAKNTHTTNATQTLPPAPPNQTTAPAVIKQN